MSLKHIPIFVLLALLALAGCGPGEYEGVIGDHPAWSPDGKTIAYFNPAFYRDGPRGIWLVNVDGSDNHYLCPGISADWSPDGEKLVVSTGSSIILIDKDGSDFEYLIRYYAPAVSPVWSPDGEWVAFLRTDGLYWINVESRAEGGYFTGAAMGDWAPDSRRIVYYRYEEKDHGQTQYLDIIDIFDSTSNTIREFDAYKDGALYPPHDGVRRRTG